jgi:hypothetical protein
VWTTDPPSESGYYLAISKVRMTDYGPFEAVKVEVDDGGVSVYRTGCEMRWGRDDFSHWFGPINPARPSEYPQ